jgi:hypothetical protein
MSQDNGHKPHRAIVRAGTLAAFLAELSPGATVRLIQTHHQKEAFRTLFLHVQALTAAGEVAWLCEAHQIMCWQEGEPAGAQDRQIADGMAALHTQLRNYLIAQGYPVRDDTDFGLPEAVKPICARIGAWTKGQDGTLVVTLDVPNPALDSTR